MFRESDARRRSVRLRSLRENTALHRPSFTDSLQLARDQMIVWPFAGVINLAGYLYARSVVTDVREMPWVVMIGPFVTWGLLSPFITFAAARWRPGSIPIRRVVAGHVLLLSLCWTVQWTLWSTNPWTADLRSPTTLMRATIYATIVCAAWTRLLLRDVLDAATFEMSAASAASAGVVRNLALPGRYFAAMLRGIADDVAANPERAELSTVGAARLLRRQLDASNGAWTVLDEVDLLDGYADLERARGTRWAITVDIAAGVETARLWPGSLAVEVASRLTETNAEPGEIIVTLDSGNPDFQASVSMGGRTETFSIAPPPPGDAPTARLSDLATALAGNSKRIITAMVVAFSLVSFIGNWLFVPEPMRLSAVSLSAIALRTVLRVLFVLPLVFALDAERPGHPFRFSIAVFGATLAAEWWYQMIIGLAWGNPAGLVWIVGTSFALSSIAMAYVTIAAIATTVYMVRVSGVAAERSRRNFTVTKRLRDSQARFLLWQTNPHFLFNALNSLASLIRSDAEAARRFISLLASFYRNISTMKSDMQTLADELDLLNRYFQIERIRFGETISFEPDIDPALSGVEVPTLLLQPVVENAGKHGSWANGTLAIRLQAHRSNDGLKITISNPAVQGPCGAEGVGLRITRERLSAIYGSDASLRVAAEGGRFITTIQLPLGRTAATG